MGNQNFFELLGSIPVENVNEGIENSYEVANIRVIGCTIIRSRLHMLQKPEAVSPTRPN